MQTRHVTWLLLAAGLGAGCAGAAKPTYQLAQAEAAVRTARELGADDVPQARLHEQLADEQMKRADKLMKDGDNAEAGRALNRARADAELALALTRHAQAQDQLQKMQPANAESATPPLSMRTEKP